MAIDGMYKPTEEELELLKRWYAPDVSTKIESNRTNAFGMNVAEMAQEKANIKEKKADVAVEDVSESPQPLSAQELDEISEQAKQQGFDEGLIKGKEQGIANGYEEGYSQGVEQGIEAGTQQGLEQAQQQIDQKLALLDSLLAQLSQPIEQQNQSIEQALVNLSLTLAEKVLHSEIQQNPGPLQQAIGEGLNLLGADKAIAIKLNPEDKQHIDQIWNEEACKTRRLSLIVDPSIAQGNCVLESNTSSVSIDMQERCAQVFDDFLAQEKPPQQTKSSGPNKMQEPNDDA